MISAVRETMQQANAQSMNATEIVKKITKGVQAGLKINKEELMEVLDYYKKLQVIYVDGDENVIFI